MPNKPVNRVLQLTTEGDQRYASGNLTGAVASFREACALLREAIKAAPGDLSSVQQLGSLLYALGEWELLTDNHDGAVQALHEAEAAYRQLPGPQAAPLVTDVLLRRARVHAYAGQPLSAVVAAQQAVARALDRARAEPGRPALIDAARILGQAGHVQLLSGGDPDLAAAAADWALREYLSAFVKDGTLALPAAYAPAVQVAARTALVVHTAAGRASLADTARWLVDMTSGGVPWDAAVMVEEIRETRPTLAAVLDGAARHDLTETLTAPANEVRLLTPAMRCDPQVAPRYAEQLAGLNVERDGPAGLLVNLEAHALYAGASEAQVTDMRYQFGQIGPHWAAAVMNFGHGVASLGRLSALADAANWIGGILVQLHPYTQADARAYDTAAAGAEFQQGAYARAGDMVRAERAGQLRQVIAARPRPDGSPRG